MTTESTKSYVLPTQTLIWQGNDTVTVATIEFAAPCSALTMAGEANRRIMMSRGGVVHNLFVDHTNAQATIVQTVTVKIEGSNTALTIDIPLGAAGPTSNTTTFIRFERGDTLVVAFDSPATSTAAKVSSFSVDVEMDSA